MRARIPKIAYFGVESSSKIASLFKCQTGTVTVVKEGPRGVSTEDEACEAVKDAAVILVNPGSPYVSRKILESAKEVRLVQNQAVGCDNIDLNAARDLGIPVANIPGYNSISVAEHTVMLILMALKKTLYVVNKVEEGWRPEEKMSLVNELREFKDKTLGLIGLGSIGKEVAKIANVFGVNVVYYKRNPLSKKDEMVLGVEYRKFRDLLAESDIVSLHVPLTDETRGLIGRDETALMKDCAIIINMTRPEVLDEHAVTEALKKGKLSAAGLDCVDTRFVDGVQLVDSPLKECENVVITPHVAGRTKESKARGIKQWVGNISRVLNGEKPLFIVNEEL